MNGKHRTSNIERRTSNGSEQRRFSLSVQRSMFSIRCFFSEEISGPSPRLLRNVLLLVNVLLGVLLTGCLVGPDYKKPSSNVPTNWNATLPQSTNAIQNDWWRIFNDPVLDKLEEQASRSNQLLRVAVARVDQSRSVARIKESPFFPNLSFDPSVTRFRTQKDHIPSQLTDTAFTLPLDFSYEIDLWGKIRRSFESARALAQASVDDYYNVLLVLHGDVAVNYFLMRELDAQIVLLEKTVVLREKSVQLVEERYRSELISELDLDRARAELAQTRTQLAEARRQRADLQDALALLCGQPTPSFEIAPAAVPNFLPTIPAGLPSALLERRPDIAEAERKMAAANARIGVAQAMRLPAITLTGDAGYSSFHASTLFDWQSRFFQIGPGATLPLLNGGRLKAGVEEARADYQASIATYQQQVLVAFKDVSDSLSDIDGYKNQAASQTDAVRYAGKTAKLSRERYSQGLVNYLDVLDSERTQLQAQIQAEQIFALQRVATVRLVKALGGGFEIAKAESVSPKKSLLEKVRTVGP